MNVSRKIPSRRYFLKSVGAPLSLPTLHSLLPATLGVGSALGATISEATTPNRMGAIGNLLGYQLPYFFPKTSGKYWEPTRLLQDGSGNEACHLFADPGHRPDGSLFILDAAISQSIVP